MGATGAGAKNAPESAAAGGPPDYGLDYPKRVSAMFVRAGWTLAFALVIIFINLSEYPGPALRMGGAIVLIAAVFVGLAFYMKWSSTAGKLQLRDQLLDQLTLNGDEKVLDVGCGRGLMSIPIAKQLDSGKVTAVDVWDPQRLSGNSPDAIRDNAQSEQVAGKLRIERGDPTNLGYANDSFDAIVAVGALQDLPDAPLRIKALDELCRVLKPGGKLLLYDRYATLEYADELRKLGVQSVVPGNRMFLFAVPAQVLIASK